MKYSFNAIESLKNFYGEQFKSFFYENAFVPKTHIRIPSEEKEKHLKEKLFKEKFKSRKALDKPIAYEILENEDLIAKTIEYALGYYYLQNISSMMPVIALDPLPGEKILDLCAAPGSKTTAIAELMKYSGSLIANDYKMDRIKILAHSVERMNCFNVGLICRAGHLLSNIYANYFDKVLVDAPCSALGIYERKKYSDWYSDQSIEKITSEQLRLLSAGVEMTKPGGVIVYSTCSFTIDENEAIIDKLLKKRLVELEEISIPLKSEAGIVNFERRTFDPSIKKCARILPWLNNSEGFFVAKLRKICENSNHKFKRPPNENIFSFYDDKTIKNLFQRIIDEFGVEEQEFRKFKYLLRKGIVYAVNFDFEIIDENIFNRIGLPFAKYDKSNRAILHSNAALILADKIKSNVYELKNEEEAKIYFNGGLIRASERVKGAVAVRWKDCILGIGLGLEGGIKSQFPTIKRSTDITEF